MTRDDNDEDGFSYDSIRADQQDPLDGAWRFGFSGRPDGMRMQEPPVFGQVLRDMEEIFSMLGRQEGQPESGHFGMRPETWSGPLPPPLQHSACVSLLFQMFPVSCRRLRAEQRGVEGDLGRTPWEILCSNPLTTTPKDPEQARPDDPEVMSTHLTRHQTFPARHSMAGPLFQRCMRYFVMFHKGFLSVVIYKVFVNCCASTFSWCLFNSLKTSGKEAHTHLQRKSTKKTEVGAIFYLSVKQVKYIRSVSTEFLSTSRSGLCSVLEGLGSDSDATCWSDTEPTQSPLLLPISDSHQGGETWWGERTY